MPEDILSSNMEEVADLPQETPEDTTESEETKGNEPEPEEAEKPEVAEPEQKPRQDPETNKAFQEMRKQLEAERLRARKADEVIARQYGKSHGIYTVEQFEQRVLEEEREANRQRYAESGLTQEEVQKLERADEWRLQAELASRQQHQQAYLQRWEELYTSHPELRESAKAFVEGGRPEWYTFEMERMVNEGNHPLLAYEFLNRQTVIEKEKAAATQSALNKLNSKNHLKANGEGADVETVDIPPDVMKMYRALNKNASEEEIRRHYKRSLKEG